MRRGVFSGGDDGVGFSVSRTAAAQRDDGAVLRLPVTLERVEATGWQTHFMRGAIRGTLKKKLRLDVVSSSVDGRGRVYRIAGRG